MNTFNNARHRASIHRLKSGYTIPKLLVHLLASANIALLAICIYSFAPAARPFAPAIALASQLLRMQ